MQATQSVKWDEMYKNKKMTWNTQDTNLSSYVSKSNVDHTIRGQGTTISTLDHTKVYIWDLFGIIFGKEKESLITLY